MKPTIEQIDDAINTMSDRSDWVEENYGTILFSLRFTKKMMGEPSEDIVEKGWVEFNTGCSYHLKRAFISMVNQAIKEVEDEN